MTLPTPITDKQMMYARLNAGLLGHTLPAVEHPDEAEEFLRKFAGPYALRLKQAGGKTRFHLTAEQVRQGIRDLPAGSWNLSGMLDDTKRVCYAHLLDGPGGWDLHYTTDPKPASLKQKQDGCEQKWLKGLAAKLYVKSVADAVGYETVCELVDLYPDHAIEFTVMRSRLDAYGPTNLIVWEVRLATNGSYEAASKWAGDYCPWLGSWADRMEASLRQS